MLLCSGNDVVIVAGMWMVVGHETWKMLNGLQVLLLHNKFLDKLTWQLIVIGMVPLQELSSK